MTSRERLLAVLNGQMPDRVPISCYELVGYDTHNFCNQEPSYQSLMDYIREKTDCICMWEPSSNEKLAFSACDPHFQRVRKELPDGYEITSTVQLGGRTLTRRDRKINNIYTNWVTEPLCKDTDDIDAIMTLPFEPLTFSNEADYDTLELGHELCLPDVRRRLIEGEPVELLDRTTGRTIPLCHSFSERQIAMLLAGGLLDYTREQNA